MFKKSAAAFLSVILTLAFASAAFAATAPPEPSSNRSFTYLGQLAPHYPTSMLSRALRSSGVTILGMEKGMILFQLTERTRATRILRNFPFLKTVYTDPAAVRKDPLLQKLSLAKDFARASRAATLRPAARKSSRNLDASGKPLLSAGAAGVTRTMLALDAALRLKASTPRARTAFSVAGAVDRFSGNNSFETAAEITAGTYDGLVKGSEDDWYKISVPAGNDLVARIDFTSSNGDLGLELYDAEGYSLMSSFTSGDSERVFTHAAETAYYYLRVRFDPNPSYSLTAQVGGLLGSISGRITEDGTSNPVSGCEVYGYDLDWNWLGTAMTAADGAYRVWTGSGDVYLWFDDVPVGNYIGEYYNDTSDWTSATTVTVAGNVIVPDINASLAVGGQISGRLRDEGGAGLFNVEVSVFSSDGEYWTGGTTQDPYVYHSLPPDTYTLCAVPVGQNLQRQWYDGKTSLSTADPIVVGVGDSVTADLTFHPGGIILGAVTRSDGAAAVEDAVAVYGEAGDYLADGTADENGQYAVLGLPAGSHRVHFSSSGNCMDEWYSNQRSFELATPVAVAVGETRSGIDAVLDRGGEVGGYVTASAGGGLKDVYIRIFDLEMNEVESLWSGSAGHWGSPDLLPGSYRILFDGSYIGYASRWYHDRAIFDEAEPVVVTAGGNTYVGQQLDPAGSLNVRVKNKLGRWIANVAVCLYDAAKRPLVSGRTDATGIVSFPGLMPGPYRVYLDPAYVLGQYVPGWYNGKASYETADPVTVTAGLQASVIAILTNKSSITVTSPASGDEWFTGEVHNITWAKGGGAQAATVKIQLYKGATLQGGGTLAATIASSAPNTGTRAWKVPAALAPGKAYRFKVTTTDGKIAGWSGIFAINRPWLTIDEPEPGTVWDRGSTWRVYWSGDGPMAMTVKILLLKGTTIVRTLATSAPNDGSFSTPPIAAVKSGTNYRVRIITTDGKLRATSGVFTIE